MTQLTAVQIHERISLGYDSTSATADAWDEVFDEINGQFGEIPMIEFVVSQEGRDPLALFSAKGFNESFRLAYRPGEGTEATPDYDLASNGTKISELTEKDWSTEYGLSKFDSIAAEKLYSWDPDRDNTCGNSTDWHWWAAMFPGDEETPALGAGVIVEEMSGGRTAAIRYDTKEDLDEAWAEREKQYAEYEHSDCADGIECEGCFSCENR